MRAELSVVIPTLNAAAALPGCLGALIEGVEAGLVRELIITDGGSEDATCLMAEEVGALVVTGPASRGGQLRRGVGASSGSWVLILHADSHLPRGWSDLVSAHLAKGSPAYFQLRFDQRGVAPALVAAWANLRARLFRLPYGDQGLLLPRDAYEAAGGYPDIPLMEDVALARALGRSLRPLPVALTTSAARYRRDGWIRRGSRNLSLLIRYLLGANPEDLARKY